ncbi:hypothetical protein WJX79_005612 [Trebouxia sp. C0005]|nr:MAG: Epoxide hydrolase [Trebouxia sp. A1-2]
MTDSPRPRPFRIGITQDDQRDLQNRLQRARLPDEQEGVAWEQGTSKAYLQDLLAYWCGGYDWPKQEAWLNSHFRQFKLRVGEIDLHYVHHPCDNPDAIPLLMIHGWPGSFMDYHKLIPKLQQKGSLRRSYHIVVPSLPGYGFSSAPSRPGFGAAEIASTLNRLMLALGYNHYVAQGGDWGTLISFLLGTRHSDHCKAIHTLARAFPKLRHPWHVAQLLNHRLPILNKMPITLTQSELKGLNKLDQLQRHEYGYRHIQGTKPQTLGYGLSDSPIGLAAWIVEKFKTWSDCQGDVERRFSKDELLTNICIYWFTSSITSSMRLYYESGVEWPNFMQQYCKVPTAIAKFPADIFSLMPRAWIEQTWNVQQYTEMQAGGHFPALEEPDLLVEDMDKFFGQVHF